MYTKEMAQRLSWPMKKEFSPFPCTAQKIIPCTKKKVTSTWL
jgi:hypothetical protein